MSFRDAFHGMLPAEEIDQIQRSLDNLVYDGGVETLTAAGAISVAVRNTKLNVTGTTAYTLANGTFAGQRKTVTVVAGASTPAGTITPATPSGFATVAAFGAIGDSCEFIWDGAAWMLGPNVGVTVA